MIKKILFLWMFLVPVSLCAEETVSFVTELFAPVGTFATLEVTDPSEPVLADHVSFGVAGQNSDEKEIFVRGNTSPFLGIISLDHSTLGTKTEAGDEDAVIQMRVNTATTTYPILMNANATLTGGALVAGEVKLTKLEPGGVNYHKMQVGETLTLNEASQTFKGAKIENLSYYDGGSQLSTTEGGEDASGISFHWRQLGTATEPGQHYILQSSDL